MINAILKGIMSLIISLVSILLAPIDLLISTLLPDLSGALNAVGAMMTFATRSLAFVIDLLGFNSAICSVIVMYFTFKLTAPIVFSTIKLAIKWYDKIKP